MNGSVPLSRHLSLTVESIWENVFIILQHTKYIRISCIISNHNAFTLFYGLYITIRSNVWYRRISNSYRNSCWGKSFTGCHFYKYGLRIFHIGVFMWTVCIPYIALYGGWDSWFKAIKIIIANEKTLFLLLSCVIQLDILRCANRTLYNHFSCVDILY